MDPVGIRRDLSGTKSADWSEEHGRDADARRERADPQLHPFIFPPFAHQIKAKSPNFLAPQM